MELDKNGEVKGIDKSLYSDYLDWWGYKQTLDKPVFLSSGIFL